MTRSGLLVPLSTCSSARAASSNSPLANFERPHSSDSEEIRSHAPAHGSTLDAGTAAVGLLAAGSTTVAGGSGGTSMGGGGGARRAI